MADIEQTVVEISAEEVAKIVEDTEKLSVEESTSEIEHQVRMRGGKF